MGSVSVSVKSSNRLNKINYLHNMGNFCWFVGQYQKAIEYYQNSLALTQKIGDIIGKATSINNLGNAHYSLEQYQQAIKYYRQSLAIAKSIGDSSQEAKSLNNLGNAFCSLSQYHEAIKYHQQSLLISQQIGDYYTKASSLNNLGNAYSFLGQYQRAIDYYQQSLNTFRGIGVRSDVALENLGIAFFESGDLAAAERMLLTSIQVQESLRIGLSDANKVSIFETQLNAYFILQEFFIAQNKLNEALEIAERGRGRAFVELLARRLSASPNTELDIAQPSIPQIQQIAKAQNATLIEYSIIRPFIDSQISELFIWVIHPTSEIAFRSVDLTSSKASLKDLVTDTRELIGVRDGNQTQALAFLPGDLVKLNDDAPDWEPWKVVAIDAESNTLSLTQSTFPEGLTIPRPLTDVAAKVETQHTNNPRLQQLYQLLIEPIADLLPTDPEAHVIFIPQNELFLVPFPALQDANGKYLIEKHTILTAPAIQVLDLTRKQQRTRQMLNGDTGNSLVVGNPTMPRVSLVPGDTPQQLTPLPHAEKEAQEIARLLQTTAITGNKANKAAIVQQMTNARLIHLATHGLLDDQYGMGSAIALAPDPPSSPLGKGGQEGGNGLLTAEEIFQLHLSAELVVLSACNTGMGRITGDGVIGLSRSLISAGVPSVIVSLWSVPDAPTADLMREFYQNFLHRGNKAAALRQAMLTTMQQHPNPRNWAAFTLIGEAD
ncbi:CHAT domain-containing protein [Microseira sp. BLCC-F43]|uniref:CHAT domain-containing protein n=1 Tax=Microseira sp. BLCC-F43 TaxID=3153602 RepID=UPI0035B92E94